MSATVHGFVCEKINKLQGWYIGQLQHTAILFEWIMFVHIDLHNSGYKLNETLSLLILH
jgi:hypothetical protein